MDGCTYKRLLDEMCEFLHTCMKIKLQIMMIKNINVRGLIQI